MMQGRNFKQVSSGVLGMTDFRNTESLLAECRN